MSQEKTLVMTFTDEMGKDYTVNLTAPKADIKEEDVRDLMQTIIDKDAIWHGTISMAGIKCAEVRVLEKTEIISKNAE